MQIVWFKRDLRIEDNPALAMAISQVSTLGDIIPLYILEPELWQQPDMSERHYSFLKDCIESLNQSLTGIGQPLMIRVGDAVNILEQLSASHPIRTLWSHQETWNGWTYQRDLRVKKWANQNKIHWYEPTQNGVVRRLPHRNGWASLWEKTLHEPCAPTPTKLNSIDIQSDMLPNTKDFNINTLTPHSHQKAGREAGLKALHTFLYERGTHYTKAMSSPVTAFNSCSRISPHLAFGTLSLKEVVQALNQRSQEIDELPRGLKGKWRSAMRSFASRLRWHCHFIQKLEDEPRMEFENLHSAYNGVRENDFNHAHFQAWQQGKTGYPMVDACMRALTATGWLNFRMRAMLMSFASYHLWLHWREPALHLARLFTDYEPGIHYSQVQMQSGTTGINSIRAYNPIKQGLEHDPDGVFVRKWIPELSEVPTAFIHTPWECPHLLGDYPLPIVEEHLARKSATDKLFAIRKQASHKSEAGAIVHKHASRKKNYKNKKTNEAPSPQSELPL